jgi:diguanylate cyclase (GGDEF)-like protein/PAS domain S-box-containing protein
MNVSLPEPAPIILIVDDEARNCRLLELLLQPEGYRTAVAASGEAALAAIADCPPDLILLDIMMPGLNGYQVAGTLKANSLTSNIPIIMITAHTGRSARLEGLSAGAEEFLTKPVDRTELWLRVRNLLRLKAFGDLQLHSSMLERQIQARTADLQRFRTAMDATADAILLVSRNSMLFIEFNATACVMLGYTATEMRRIGPVDLGVATLAQLERLYDDMIAGTPSHELFASTLRRKDGTMVQVEIHRQVMRSGDDWVVVGVVRDITERKQAEERLLHQAHHDALTGLPNRTLFFATLGRTLAMASDSSLAVAVMFIDLDHFKDVNDTLGHAVGDELLVQVGNRLTECVRLRDTIGRLGGDEFALILVLQERQQGARLIAAKIGTALRQPFRVDGNDISVTASIGVAVFPDDATDPDVLLRYADTAMYRAKEAGRNTYRFFTAQMNADVLARLELELALRKAIEHEEFELYYQPKVHLDTGRVAGVEALLRWRRPGHGLVAPDLFMPVLEETGMIIAVGGWVIDQACQQIAIWMRSPVGAMPVAVNVAGRQFVEGDLESNVMRALAVNGVPAELLELELTETSLMANTGQTSEILGRLKQQGVHISIDDFGTGYSSLAYLRRFPIDKLKIDIAFIRDITTNPDDAAIVRAITHMAHSLKLEVVAEGVETEAQLSFLRRNHCDQIQGYYFSRPLPEPQLTVLLAEDRRLAPLDPGPSRRHCLLIVDDDPFMAEILAEVLARDGYHILIAGSATQGFDLLARYAVQVILCDQCMPQMTGIMFMDRVKELYPDTFRIVVSGAAELPLIIDAINRGAISRFYTKPWNGKLLREAIATAFQRHDAAQPDRGPDVRQPEALIVPDVAVHRGKN